MFFFCKNATFLSYFSIFTYLLIAFLCYSTRSQRKKSMRSSPFLLKEIEAKVRAYLGRLKYISRLKEGKNHRNTTTMKSKFPMYQHTVFSLLRYQGSSLSFCVHGVEERKEGGKADNRMRREGRWAEEDNEEWAWSVE